MNDWILKLFFHNTNILKIINLFIITFHWDGVNNFRSTKSKKLFMKINHLDEDKICFKIDRKHIEFHMNKQIFELSLKWGIHPTHPEWNCFLFNIKNSKGRMYKTHVYHRTHLINSKLWKSPKIKTINFESSKVNQLSGHQTQCWGVV
jgi:hypothetical protein